MEHELRGRRRLVWSASAVALAAGLALTPAVALPDVAYAQPAEEFASVQDAGVEAQSAVAVNGVVVVDTVADLTAALRSADNAGKTVMLADNFPTEAVGQHVWVRAEGVTLDLNGKTLNMSGDYVLGVTNSATIKNGTILKESGNYATVQVTAGTVTLDGAKVSRTGGLGVYAGGADVSVVLGSGSEVAVEGAYDGVFVTNKAALTVNEGASVKSGSTAVDLADGATANIAGGSLDATGNTACGIFTGKDTTVNMTAGSITSSTYGISGNGSHKNGAALYDGTTYNITGGTISVSGNDGAGVYQPQKGAITVGDGATISGPVGISIRDGSLTMTGGTVTATVETPASFTGNWANGVVIDGAAISVPSHTAYGDVELSITGGTLNTAGDNSKLLVYNWSKDAKEQEGGVAASETTATKVSVTIGSDVADAAEIVKGMSAYAPKDHASAAIKKADGTTTYVIGTASDVKAAAEAAGSGDSVVIYDASSAGLDLTLADGVKVSNASAGAATSGTVTVTDKEGVTNELAATDEEEAHTVGVEGVNFITVNGERVADGAELKIKVGESLQLTADVQRYPLVEEDSGADGAGGSGSTGGADGADGAGDADGAGNAGNAGSGADSGSGSDGAGGTGADSSGSTGGSSDGNGDLTGSSAGDGANDESAGNAGDADSSDDSDNDAAADNAEGVLGSQSLDAADEGAEGAEAASAEAADAADAADDGTPSDDGSNDAGEALARESASLARILGAPVAGEALLSATTAADPVEPGAQLEVASAAEQGDVTWTSSDPSVASVTQDGLVTALSAGNATITAASTTDPTQTQAVSIVVQSDESGSTDDPATDPTDDPADNPTDDPANGSADDNGDNGSGDDAGNTSGESTDGEAGNAADPAESGTGDSGQTSNADSASETRPSAANAAEGSSGSTTSSTTPATGDSVPAAPVGVAAAAGAALLAAMRKIRRTN